jgi:hypothetical protein
MALLHTLIEMLVLVIDRVNVMKIDWGGKRKKLGVIK